MAVLAACLHGLQAVMLVSNSMCQPARIPTARQSGPVHMPTFRCFAITALQNSL